MKLKSIYFITSGCGGGNCLAKFTSPFHFIRFSNSAGGKRIAGGWRKTSVGFDLHQLDRLVKESLTVAEAQARFPKAFPSPTPDRDKFTAYEIGVD